MQRALAFLTRPKNEHRLDTTLFVPRRGAGLPVRSEGDGVAYVLRMPISPRLRPAPLLIVSLLFGACAQGPGSDAAVETALDAGKDAPAKVRDAGVARDGGVAAPADAGLEHDAGASDAGPPPPMLEILSDPPVYGIVGVLYRYRPIVETTADVVTMTLISGPSDAMLDEQQVLRWTPTDNTTANFTIGFDADGVVVEQTFAVEVATPQTVATTTIGKFLGGTLTVTSTQSALTGVTIKIAAGALEADTEISIAELIGPTESAPVNHTAHTPPFVILPEIAGVSVEIDVPLPDSLQFGEDELPLLATAANDLPLDVGGRGRFQDVVVTLDDLAPAEARVVRAHLKLGARYIQLVSGRYLRLAGPNTRLYWNLAEGEAPPTAMAERVIATAEQSINVLTGIGFGCSVTSSVAVFVVPFSSGYSGFAYPGAVYLRPKIATGDETLMRYVMAHEVVHVAQHAMLPRWRYDPIISWWAEAGATYGADEMFDDKVWVRRYGLWTQRLVSRGLIGSIKNRRAYQLSLFLKHLEVTEGFRLCRLMRLQRTPLTANDFGRALEATTGNDAVKHLANFTAAYSAHRHPELIEDIDLVPILFSPFSKTLDEVPITVDFHNIAGGRAWTITPATTGPITVQARLLSSTGAGARVVFYQEKNGELEELGQIADDEAILEDVDGTFTIVAASVGLAKNFSAQVELEEGLRINGVVHDVHGQPVRAHVTLDEQPDPTDDSSMLDGRFGLKRVNSSTHNTVTVRATCASDTSLTATAPADLTGRPTVDVGTLMFTGECPSIEILTPSGGTKLQYGPYRIAGLTNLPFDRLEARVDGRSNRRAVLSTTPTPSGVRTFEGVLANDWMDEGEHVVSVFSNQGIGGRAEVTVEKVLPRIWGKISRQDLCENSCPRVATAHHPGVIADLRERCRAEDLAKCADRISMCSEDVLGGTIRRSGNGDVRYTYERTLTCAAANCRWAGNNGPCDGVPFDMVYDTVALNHIDPSAEPQIGEATIVQGYDCRATVGRAVYTAPECPDGHNAFCSFEFSHDACRFCGDGQCGPFESDRCPADCGSCGDGVCSVDGRESALSCPADCGSCGDGICSVPSEDSTTCSLDCVCGNGICDPSEVTTCAADCE